MNFNKSLLRISSRCPALHQSLAYKFTGTNSFTYENYSKTFIRNLVVKIPLKYCRVVPYKVSFHLYSSVVNEGQAVKKHPDSVITVPSLEFKDVEFEQPVSYSDLCDALQICNSVDEQMFALASTLSLSQEDIDRRVNFCKVIESLFRPFFGEIKIQMFGSTVNGFGFKGCDIDMSFETFAEQKEKISYLESPDIPLVSEVMCGKVTPREICLLPRKEQLLFIYSLLLEFYKESADPTIFINAHIPLIRFYHDKYNLKCDLSCGNKVAFANTKLLYLFGKLDERVIPMIMAIRYWAKHVELIGKGMLFNTYTITLLVIHFLQTRKPPILPSAEHILSISDSLGIDDMDDKTFLDIKKSIKPSENTQTLSELLRDFFFFYLYFDFTRVICPLIGGSVPRDRFFSDEANKKFKMNSICVQDPMMVSHNVAEIVEYKHCRKLFTDFMAVCQILQDNTTFSSSSSSKWGLLTILDIPLDVPGKYFSNSARLQRNVSFSIPIFTKPIINKVMSEDANNLTAETLMYLLNHILLFEIKPLNVSDVIKLLKTHDQIIEKQTKKILEYENKMNLLQEISQKLRKKDTVHAKKNYLPSNPMLEEFQKFNLEHKLVLCAECKAGKNIWLGRDIVSLEHLPPNSLYDLIEKERYVSVNAAKQNELNSLEDNIKPFKFFVECYVSPKRSESSLLINFRPFQRTNFNPILGIFLKEYIPKLIQDLKDC